ncbi:hypothetical protein D3C78_1988700 [compost metagenome]
MQAFLEIVAPYPLGTTVKLNTGEIGVVVAIEKGLPQRPALRLIGDYARDEFRLTEHHDRVIVGVIEV